MASTCCKIVRRSGLLIGLSLAMLSGNAQAQQVPLPTTPADVAGPPPGTAMTKEYVQMIGRMAYLWKKCEITEISLKKRAEYY